MCSVLQFAGSVEADYGSTANLSISFPPASRIISLSVTIIQDVFTEINETFSVVLSSVFLTHSTGGATIDLSDQERARLILIPNVTTVKILDDDGIKKCIAYHDLTVSLMQCHLLDFKAQFHLLWRAVELYVLILHFLMESYVLE